MAKKVNLKKIADNLLKDNPDQVKVWVTEDGQGFFKQNYAKNNADNKGLEDPEVFFREGHSDEGTQDLEEALQETESALQGLEIILNTVIDASNTEAEEPYEVKGDDHEAVKAVAELRNKYDAAIVQTNAFKLEVKDELDFNAKVVELIEGNDTKLAESIRALIPTKD